jgi:hypothetical protein
MEEGEYSSFGRGTDGLTSSELTSHRHFILISQERQGMLFFTAEAAEGKGGKDGNGLGRV